MARRVRLPRRRSTTGSASVTATPALWGLWIARRRCCKTKCKRPLIRSIPSPAVWLRQLACSAPRGLNYAHEFAWDRERDPVWARLEKIYGFYDAKDKLSFATGRGGLSGRSPEATHCDNIGPEHRKPMYPTLQKWFGIAPPETENTKRYPGSELQCLTDEARKQFGVMPLHKYLDRAEKFGKALYFDGPLWWEDAVESKLLQAEAKNGVTWQRFQVVSKNDPLAAIPVLWLKPAKAQAKEVVVA